MQVVGQARAALMQTASPSINEASATSSADAGDCFLLTTAYEMLLSRKESGDMKNGLHTSCLLDPTTILHSGVTII